MRLPAAERRQQLLDVALKVFAERGFHTTSMNDVADAAGVTKPVLYQHFSSKRELYLELLAEVGGALRETIAKATADADHPREQVEAGFRAYFTFVADNADAFRVLFGAGVRRDPEFAAQTRAVEDSVAATIAELIVVDDLPVEHRAVLAHGIVGMAEAAVRYWMTNDVDLSPDELASRLSELAWAGMRGVRTQLRIP